MPRSELCRRCSIMPAQDTPLCEVCDEELTHDDAAARLYARVEKHNRRVRER